MVAALERGLSTGRRLRIRYRGTKDWAARWRRVDPLGIRLADGHVYLVAHDLEAGAVRTFKAARTTQVEVLREAAAAHPAFDAEALFRHSVKVWVGEPVEVAVWLAEDVASLVPEWPLRPDQSVTDGAGGVVVRASVAGIEETVRWVLGWGRHARPLEPQALVEAVRAEHEGAIARLETTRPRHVGTGRVHKA